MTNQPTLKDIASGSLTEVSALIRQREVSPIDVVTACLERIERFQPRLNAFITVTPEKALQQAKVAEAEIRRGNWKGALHGVPIGIKDFYDTAGIKTTAAFAPFRNRIPGTDAAAVAQLKRSGAIVIGKTNMHSLGMGTTGLESCFGPAKNPWNAGYIPGGSSSGSATAVASGMCYATLDTDAIGSCRLPAACCGVVGFKGTYGLIDMAGILAGERPPDETIEWMSHVGITVRRVEDAALVLDALSERIGPAVVVTFLGHLDQKKSLRVGVATNGKSDAEVSEALERATETIRGLGYVVSEVAAPFVDLSKGIAKIKEDRTTIANAAFNRIDVMILPTIPFVTPSVADSIDSPQALSPENTLFANYYGLPAISVPCGFDKRGLPLGMQCISKPGDEAAVLGLAHHYQMASGYAVKHPLP
jgi:aspartyl-tRNA(Asn)/glutamyl-tRNA(Gln) amidotransferase subunit A